MGWIRRKGGEATFLLFTSKWSKIQEPKEIEKQKAKNPKDTNVGNTHLLDKNRPISILNEVLNVNDNLSNTDLVAGSEAESETGLEA